MQQTVRLLGDLGERYGAEHRYHNLRSPSEAIKLLCINYPALQKELTYAHEQGIGYKVIQAGLELDYDDLALPLGQNDLIVTPVVAGSGGGTGTILAGVGLIAASIIFAPAAGGFLGAGLGVGSTTTATFSLAAGAYVASTSAVLSAGLSVALGSIGAALVLGGVAEMLSPQPKLPSFDGGTSGMQRFGGGARAASALPGASAGESYAFNGPANVAGVGTVIPVAYGNVIIGSRLLSARLEVTNEGSDPEAKNPQNRTIVTPGPQTIRLNNNKLNSFFLDLGNNSKARQDETLVTAGDQSDEIRLINEQVEARAGKRSSRLEIPDHRDRTSIDIIFRLQTGLYDRVSGVDSARVIGNFTYEVIIYSGKEREDRITHRSQTNISGLLNATDFNAPEATRATQKFRWLQRFKWSVVEGDNAYIRVKIIDSDVFTGSDGFPIPTLKIHAVGTEIPKQLGFE